MASLALPITKPVRSADPTFEPITLAEAKKQVGLADGVQYHDEHLNSLIKTAREQVEHDTGIVLATGTFVWKFTDWPCEEWFEIPSIRPVSSITSIVYTASDGTATTWSSSNYTLETSTVTPMVRLAYLQSWPTLRGDINGITVTMVAGYATQLTIPNTLKDLVKLQLQIGWLLRNESDAEPTIRGYERHLMRALRSTYP